MPAKAVCFRHKSIPTVLELNTDLNDVTIVWMISIIKISLILITQCWCYTASILYTTYSFPGDLRIAQNSGETPHQSAVDSHQLLGRHHVRLVQTNPASNLRHTHSGPGPVWAHLILSSCSLIDMIACLNSSEMSSLCASKSRMILSALSANHLRTSAKS